MKFTSSALLLLTASSVSAGGIAPELSVGLSTDDLSEMNGSFAPNVKWSGSGSNGDLEYEGGVNMDPDSIKGNAPFGIWGKLRREVGGWDIQAKIDTQSNNFRSLDIGVEAAGGPTDCKLRARGELDTESQSGEVREVGLSQSFDAPGGEATVSPSYNLASGKADVVVAYNMAESDTLVTVAADADKQKITIAQRLDEENEIAPSLTSDGEFECGYKRVIGDGVMTANYRPNDITSIQYEEGPWVAKAEFPMDGKFGVGGPSLAVKRSIVVETN